MADRRDPRCDIRPPRIICGLQYNLTTRLRQGHICHLIVAIVLNVAAGKAPMQSSVADGGIPQKAVDGSTATTFSLDTCTLTSPEPQSWWYVNLLEPYMVQLVRLDFGLSCCGNAPATITVRVGNNRPDLGVNPVCNRFTGILEEGRPLFLPCNPPMPGAFVSVHLEAPNGPQQLSICEAFIYTDQALPIERCPSFRDQRPGSTATYNGKCYIFYNSQPRTFDEALESCSSRGGSLVDETNPALQGFLSWELWRRHRGDSNGQYWLGAVRDPHDINNWKWINGGDVTVSFWNLPGGNENCARFDGTKGWLWSDTNCNANINFICQHRPQTCGKPEQPPNSTMVSGGGQFAVGTEVQYKCDSGHVLVGPQTRSCLNSGFFNEFPPTCRYLECGLPAPIRHGEYSLVNGTRHYLSHVLYRCQQGYTMVGRDELICDIDERWNGPPPRCIPVRCVVPEAPIGGTVMVTTPWVRVGQRVAFSCHAELVLVGKRELLCNANGVLSHEPPICKVDRAAKPALPDTTNSQVPPYLGQRDDKNIRRNYFNEVNNDLANENSETVVEDADTANNNNINNNRRPTVDGPGYNLKEGGIGITKSTEKLHLGGIIALGVFGGFVFLAAVVTTIVILVRRTQSGSKKYHRRNEDGSGSSYDSSQSSDGHGLNKYYKRAWENLQESGDTENGGKSSRQTLDNPDFRSSRSADTHDLRSNRSIGHEGLRDGSEMTVNDVAAMYTRPEKQRRHHHHHHHHHGHRSSSGGGGHKHSRPEHTEGHDREWRDRQDRRKY
ncbi:unnamed protein product, partial [Meganyctiphanes norvegica]